MKEANSQTKSQHPKLSNFKGKVHTLTKEDRKKGGRAVSDKKKLANSFNPITNGKYAKKVPHCHTCPLRSRCSAYDPKEPKAACKVIDIPNYFHLLKALTFKDEQDFDDFVSKLVQRLYVKNLTSNEWSELKDFLLIFLKIKDSKFKTPREQTVNVQINNFHTEFQLFKDVTIKVLSKHPKLLKEWRAQLEANRQSD